MDDELISLHKMQIMSWFYLLALTLGSWLIMSWSFAWPVVAGGVISILSFISSHKDVMKFVESLTPDDKEKSEEATDTEKKEAPKLTKVGFILRFWLRIIVIGVLLLLLIKFAKANVFGLIIGLSTMVFTITFTAVSVARRYLFGRLR